MSNQYIYFSSEGQQGNNPHADFQIMSSDPIVIQPGSEIRCCSLYINQKQNTVEIDSNNDTFAFSIGRPFIDPNEHTAANSFCFYKVQIPHGNYVVDPGNTHNEPEDYNVYLAPAIQKAMNKAWSNNSLFRGGFSVSINASLFLVVKLSPMTEEYEVPTVIKQNDKEYIAHQTRFCHTGKDDDIDTLVRGPKYLSSGVFPARDGDTNTYCSIGWVHDSQVELYNDQLNAFITPSVNVFGNSDSVNDKLFFKYYVDLSTADFNGVNPFGKMKNSILISGSSDTTEGINDNPAGGNSVFYTQLDSSGNMIMRNQESFRVIVTPNQTNLNECLVILFGNDGVIHFSANINNTDKLILEGYCQAPTENENAHKYKFQIWTSANNAAYQMIGQTNYQPFIALNDIVEEFNGNCDNYVFNKPNTFRLAIGNTFSAKVSYPAGKNNFTSVGNAQYLTWATDPLDGLYGFYDGAYQEANSLVSANTDIGNKMPLILYGQDKLSNPTKNYLRQKYPLDNHVYSWQNEAVLEQCDCNIGDQLFVGIGYTLDQEGSKTYTTGCKDTTGTILRNSQDMPACFLDCPSLSLENSTLDATFGKRNNYLCPIVYPSTSNTSAITMGNQMLWNSIKSSYEQRLTSLRLRICKMDGTVATDLAPYTWGCLEIRKSKEQRENEFFKKLEKTVTLTAKQQGWDTLEPQPWDKQVQ